MATTVKETSEIEKIEKHACGYSGKKKKPEWFVLELIQYLARKLLSRSIFQGQIILQQVIILLL